MTNVMYQDLTVKDTIDAGNIGSNLLAAIRRDRYEVGDVYISTNATSPASKYGGTWEQLDEDAYFKIVTSGAGSYGGTSNEHKIPLTSIPSTTNSITAHLGPYDGYQLGLSGGNTTSNYLGITSYDVNKGGAGYLEVNNGGGGQAYYPYYYGLYAWVRTA